MLKAREQMKSGWKMPGFSDKGSQIYTFKPLRPSRNFIYYQIRHSQFVFL